MCQYEGHIVMIDCFVSNAKSTVNKKNQIFDTLKIPQIFI